MTETTARPNVPFGTGGFPTAESSIHTLRISVTKVSDRVVYADLPAQAGTQIKNEDTWYRKLGHYDAEYDTALRVFILRWAQDDPERSRMGRGAVHGRFSIRFRRRS